MSDVLSISDLTPETFCVYGPRAKGILLQQYLWPTSLDRILPTLTNGMLAASGLCLGPKPSAGFFSFVPHCIGKTGES
jgi:hypothetical protein